LLLAAYWDLLQSDHVRGVVENLRYAAYLLMILGAWKLAGAVALVIPGFPTIKEWAYSGALITYTSAIASQVIIGTGIGALVAAIVLLALTVASWALHPPLTSVPRDESPPPTRDEPDNDGPTSA